MTRTLIHRGPDDHGVWSSPDGQAVLGHRRLSIIDRSPAAHQPMVTENGRFTMVFNGEIYNYREVAMDLRCPARGDTEVLLFAYQQWGIECLDRLVGMFAFAVWDERDKELVLVRDRFGVKPLYVAMGRDGSLLFASEVKALHAGGVPARPDSSAWATYLATGYSDFADRTFWQDVAPLPPGQVMRWSAGRADKTAWYDLLARAEVPDERPDEVVADELRELLVASVALRFRSDVPVGINVSGGLDSSTLLGAVDAGTVEQQKVHAFTFVCGDPRYDELPWVEELLAGSGHQLHVCELSASAVPELAASVQRVADEPFGGLPTLAYALLFEQARRIGVIVLLDGQGMDEQWAGYDYYMAPSASGASIIQGTSSPPVRSGCLHADFSRLALSVPEVRATGDRLLDLQYRDLTRTKIPRALRYNDRISMRSSVELREPFLDHRLVELAFRQPADRKIRGGVQKYLLRTVSSSSLPTRVVSAPKRPMQTPQREWLRGPLQPWVRELVARAFEWQPGWLDVTSCRSELDRFMEGEGDNSFFVWQWVTMGLIAEMTRA